MQRVKSDITDRTQCSHSRLVLTKNIVRICNTWLICIYQSPPLGSKGWDPSAYLLQIGADGFLFAISGFISLWHICIIYGLVATCSVVNILLINTYLRSDKKYLQIYPNYHFLSLTLLKTRLKVYSIGLGSISPGASKPAVMEGNSQCYNGSNILWRGLRTED